MKLSEAVKPVSYFKAHASEILRELENSHKTMIITQNGEAKAVLQDIKLYEEMQESLSLLKILALSAKSKEEKNFNTIEDSFDKIYKKIEQNK